jgi:cholesterol oxidase
MHGKSGNWIADVERAGGLKVGRRSNQRKPLRACAVRFDVDVAVASGYSAFAAVSLHTDFPFISPEVPNDPVVGFALRKAARDAIDAFVTAGGEDLEASVFYLDGAIASRDGVPFPTAPITFALASCQYPPGLMDLECAEASYLRLYAHLESKDALRPKFLLLCGDQVYLDATAGVFDPAGAEPDDVARRAYELNWRMPSFRKIAARLPIYTMLDDHEVIDNWQPPAVGVEPTAPEVTALAAFRSHQSKLNPPPLSTGPGASFAYEFAPGGLPFFVLDSRSRRERRSVDGAPPDAFPLADARIIPDDDMDRLKE